MVCLLTSACSVRRAGRVASHMVKMKKTRSALLAGGVVAILAAPVAMGAGEGQPLDGGARNPSNDTRQSYTKETEVIANTATYGTRQSNKSDNGGGAVYGCRSKAGGSAAKNEPCLRGVNLNVGSAFEFATGGLLGGLITVGKGGDAAKPFTTNATGVATGLNADRVDGKNGDDLLTKTDRAADADKLDGRDSTSFASAGDLLFARVGADGTTVSGSRPSGVTSAATDADTTTITFPKDVSNCSATATESGATPSGAISAAISGTDVAVNIETARQPVNVQVIC
jgi:hypothetical protein